MEHNRKRVGGKDAEANGVMEAGRRWHCASESGGAGRRMARGVHLRQGAAVRRDEVTDRSGARVRDSTAGVARDGPDPVGAWWRKYALYARRFASFCCPLASVSLWRFAFLSPPDIPERV